MAKPFAAVAGRAIRTAGGKSDSRNGLIKAVRAASRRLGLEDEDRRRIQLEVTGRHSLGDMNLAEIGKVLDRLNRDYKGPQGQRSYLAKIRALWWTLYWLGGIHEPNDEALAAFVARQTGKERLQFLGHKEAYSVIEALKSWAARLGVDWPVPARLAEARAHNPAIEPAQLDRHAVLSAIAAKCREHGVLRTIDHTGYLERAIGLSPTHWAWTARELDACIRELGRKLRRATKRRGKMADGTSIEWADATVNAVNGCSVLSPGCTNCYAMRLAGTRMKTHPSRAGLTIETKAGPVWNGEVRLSEKAMLEPLRWRRPRRIFWNAHGDLFHENVPDEWIDRCFAVMALTPHHQHQVLTKRAERMREYVTRLVDEPVQDTLRRIVAAWPPRDEAGRRVLTPEQGMTFPLPNVWLGVSVEDQARADERIPHLLATPAAVRFLSCEPLLGPVDLHEYLLGFSVGHPADCDCGHGHGFARCPNYGRIAQRCHRCSCADFRKALGSSGLHLVIAGGESGPKARPMHPSWARLLRDQCAAAGVPFFFKQWGEWRIKSEVDPTALNLHDYEQRMLDEGTSGPFVRVGKKAAGRLLDGLQHDEVPA